MVKSYNAFFKLNEQEQTNVNDNIQSTEQTTGQTQSVQIDIESHINELLQKITSTFETKYKNMNNKYLKVLSFDGKPLLNDDNSVVSDVFYLVAKYKEEYTTVSIKLLSYEDGIFTFERFNDKNNKSLDGFEFLRKEGDKLENEKTKSYYIISDINKKDDVINKFITKTKDNTVVDNTDVQKLQDEKIKSEYSEKELTDVMIDVKNKIKNNKYNSEQEVYNEILNIFKLIYNSTTINNDVKISLLVKFVIEQDIFEKYPSVIKLKNTKDKYIKLLKNNTQKTQGQEEPKKEIDYSQVENVTDPQTLNTMFLNDYNKDVSNKNNQISIKKLYDDGIVNLNYILHSKMSNNDKLQSTRSLGAIINKVKHSYGDNEYFIKLQKTIENEQKKLK